MRGALAGLGITPPEEIGDAALAACAYAARLIARCEPHRQPAESRTLTIEGCGVFRITQERAALECAEAGEMRRMWEEERERERDQEAAARYAPWTGSAAALRAVQEEANATDGSGGADAEPETVPVNQTAPPARRNLLEEMAALVFAV